MEIAVFGGTFDPPTKAHELIIQAALDHPEIDEVWVMPSGSRIDKPHMSDESERITMLELMKTDTFKGNRLVKITDFEMRLPQPTRTDKTVRALKKAFPGNNYWFIFGADSYYDMPNWESGKKLQRELGMLLVPRQGFVLPVAKNVRMLGDESVFIPDMSSTQVREAMRNNQDISCFVCKAVASFLQSHHSYETSYN